MCQADLTQTIAALDPVIPVSHQWVIHFRPCYPLKEKEISFHYLYSTSGFEKDLSVKQNDLLRLWHKTTYISFLFVCLFVLSASSGHKCERGTMEMEKSVMSPAAVWWRRTFAFRSDCSFINSRQTVFSERCHHKHWRGDETAKFHTLIGRSSWPHSTAVWLKVWTHTHTHEIIMIHLR